jgi:hypothetical protein
VIILRQLGDEGVIGDADIRALTRSRLEFMAEEDLLGGDTPSVVIVMEAGDSASTALMPHLHFDVLTARYSGCRFNERGYSSPFETLDEYPSFFEAVLVLSDYGDGVVLLVPKLEGVDADLLAMCAMHAVPASEPSS